MNTNPNEIIECESVSVRIGAGKYFEFPIVDNKDMFPHFFRANSDSNLQLQVSCLDELIYALYRREGNIFYLVCAWEKEEEINDEARKLIASSQKLINILN